MPAEFLDCEFTEIRAEESKLDKTSFNIWFDDSPIKKRFKKAAMKQQKLRCCYCNRLQLDHNNNLWDLEHILCESLYPEFFAIPLNLAVACKRCNIAKREKDVLHPAAGHRPTDVPNSQQYYTIPHPHLSVWADHVKHTAYLIYEGLSVEGAALIKCCSLNGRAEEAVGSPPGAIRTAITTRFFAKLGGNISSHLAENDALLIVSASVEAVEKVQIEQAMKRLHRSLATYDRAARKRNGLV